MSMDLNAKRILIIKQSSLGDIIHALPLAHALKRCHPACRIGWLVEEGAASLVDSDPSVDAVHAIHIPSTSDPRAGRFAYLHALSATLGVLRRLRADFKSAPYDLLLDLHASFRSGLLGLMNPGGQRIGFADARELNGLFQNQHLTVPDGVVHAVDKNLLFAARLGCAVQPEDFFIATTAGDEQRVLDFLTEAGIAAAAPLAYVNPAARWQSKHWLVQRWSRLCDRLAAAGVRAVFGGSAADLPYIREILGQMEHPGIVAAGRLGLRESVALIRRARVYVGVDTGPMHMAAMVGTPVVALFGPTHPERVGPYGVRSSVLQAGDVDCLCCRRRECSRPLCMEGISVEQVLAEVLRMVEAKGKEREAACAPA